MARMIPPYISREVKSTAEKRIYRQIQESEELIDFTCLHSLGLSRHMRKRQGELDFVLIGNQMILCLEVKGGRVTRKNGVWFFKDKYGQENKKTESPFSQVSTGMFSLKKDLESKFGAMPDIVFGYGVLFPDIDFDKDSPEWDSGIIYNLDDTKKPFHLYLERLSDYWRNKFPGKNEKSNLSKSSIVSYLRGDFEMTTRLWDEITNTESEITFFTEEQFRALDHMESNPRTIFTGAAGTGKTLLALEKAKRSFHNKQKTLFLCFNRLLGARIAKETTNIDPKGEYVQTNSIHKYFSKTIELAGMKQQLDRDSSGKDAQEVFNIILPKMFIDASKKLNKDKFDCLIIDEGQDLLSENYLLALNGVLSGGLKKGCWTIFLDPGGQAKLFNRFSLAAFNHLKSIGVPEYKLDLNVRNTLQIATQASIISGFPAGKTRIEGPKVEYKLCNDETEMALQIVKLLNSLIKEELIPASCITILSNRNIGSMSLFASGVKVPRNLLEANENNISELQDGKILYASAQAFKGLENNVIVYADVGSLDGSFSEAVNYVAMTRAKEKLYVFMDSSLKKEYEVRLNKYLGVPKI